MKLVTSGVPFLDIDGYAGCVAYAELLRLQGEDAIAASASTWNDSIPPVVRDWKVDDFSTDFSPSRTDEIVLIDVSGTKNVDPKFSLDRVVEVIDHHSGFEAYWQEKLGERSHIEEIGAACTVVAERWQQAGKLPGISATSAALLVCGILDNTLNFTSGVTKDRDYNAYETLLPVANLPSDWTQRYFASCQEMMLRDISSAVKNDMKVIEYETSPARELIVGQLVLWDAQKILHDSRSEVLEVLRATGRPFFANIVSISENKSYFLAMQPEIREWLEALLEVQFVGDVASADRSWLRKEITRRDMAKAQDL